MSSRFEEELALLQQHYPNMAVKHNWVKLPDYPLPDSQPWNRKMTDVVFIIPSNYPSAPPYGFFVQEGLQCNGTVPGSYTEHVNEGVPFEGIWSKFSWSAETRYMPTMDIHKGPNLLNFVQSFARRFSEGC